ncbi:hypothetical protein Tco_0308498 [Tanacetum coccineum]
MGEENPIRTLGYYSKPSHEGYRNTIELPIGNNVVPLRSDTIRLVQNRFSFHGLRSEDPNQHLKDFLKLMDSLDLDDDNRERTRLFHSNPRPQSHNEPSKLNPFTFRKRTGPSPQPQAFGTTFEARVRDYMAAHTERMEIFKNAIFKQREEINDRMTVMFGLLKELTTSKTLEKVLLREEAKSPVTKNVNSISLTRGEEERSDKTNETLGNTVKPTGTETGIPVKEAEGNNEIENKPIEKAEKEEVVEAPSSRPVEYYLKHRINEKLIEGLVNNPRFNNSGARVGKVKGKTYNVSPRRHVYDAILKKKITKKEDIRGNFKIPCSTGGLKNELFVTTHTKFTARINNLLKMRQTIDSLLFKTINELTNQSFDSEIFCPEERIKEIELRTQRRNNFEEELFKDRFPTEEELASHKELLGEPQPSFSTLETKIRRGDP